MYFRSGKTLFTFVCGTQQKHKGGYIIPAFIADRRVKNKTDVVDSEIPLLLSRNEMNDRAEIFGKTVLINMVCLGYYSLPTNIKMRASIDNTTEVQRQRNQAKTNKDSTLVNSCILKDKED